MGKSDKNISRELDDILKRIYSWYRSKIKILSILTSPFNTNLIFGDIISEMVRSNNKVLYVWGKNCEDKDLLGNIIDENKGISYCKLEKGIGECDINFVHYRNLENIQGNYGLTILDDISSFSTLNRDGLRGKYEVALKLSQRVIAYLAEAITPLGDKIEFPPVLSSKPFIEPRLITTRIDLNKDIPYILYDYLKWFRDNKKKVMIYVPNKEKLEAVYDYYTKRLKMDGVIIKSISRSDDKKAIKSVLKIRDKATFIITDFMEVSLDDRDIGDAIVLFADNIEYSFKKLIYICGQISRTPNKSSEILFVSRDVTDSIDAVREMSRDFNKMLWEKRLKNI